MRDLGGIKAQNPWRRGTDWRLRSHRLQNEERNVKEGRRKLRSLKFQRYLSLPNTFLSYFTTLFLNFLTL